MNYKIKLSGLTINAPELPAEFKIDALEIEVEKLDLKDSLKVAKALPKIMLDIRRAMELPLDQADVSESDQAIEEPDVDDIKPGQYIAVQLTENRTARGVVDKISRFHIYLEGIAEPLPKVEITSFAVLEAADDNEA